MSVPHQASAEPRMTPAVQWIIAANVGVYFLQLTLLGAPTVFGALGLDPSRLSSEWWTPLTYMFVHAGLLHITFNLLALWMFGPRVEAAWSAKAFTWFYLWCGLGGAIAHILLSGGSSLVGASAAVSGVLLAYALRWPDEEVYLFGAIPMRSRWLVVWMIGINLAMGIASNSTGSGIAWFSHLGGLAFGWIYLRVMSFGGLDGFRRWVSPVPDVPDDAFRAVPKTRSRRQRADRGDGVDDIVAKSNALATRPARPALLPRVEDTEKRAAERMNLVLDKISKHGIESLTLEELKLLEEASRKLRES